MYLQRLYRPARFSIPRVSHRCSDAGTCDLVSERQAGFASKTDAVGSEGIEELCALVVMSTEILMLAAQPKSCCDWQLGWQWVMPNACDWAPESSALFKGLSLDGST